MSGGVTCACFCEPDVQRSYKHMAELYGTAILPAHKGKPKHKAKVAVGVQVVQRTVLARLRERVGAACLRLFLGGFSRCSS